MKVIFATALLAAAGNAFYVPRSTPGTCNTLPSTVAQVGCGQQSGFTWVDINGRTAIGAPNNASLNNVHGVCTAGGTQGNNNGADSVCGNITFLFECQNRTGPATYNVQFVAIGTAQQRNGNDDSVYAWLDNGTAPYAARTIHTGWRTFQWRNSRPLVAGRGAMLANGIHTITLSEREDGSFINAIRITGPASSVAQCRFLPYQPPTTIAPQCQWTNPLTASVGCGTIQGFDYVATQDYAVATTVEGHNGFCNTAGVYNQPTLRPVPCGNITWQFFCSQNTTVNFGVTGRAENPARRGNDDSVYVKLNDGTVTTVHTNWNANRWTVSRAVFGQVDQAVTAGMNTFIVLEREDGSAIRNVTIGGLGAQYCNFVVPTQAPTPPPTSPLLPNVTSLQTVQAQLNSVQVQLSATQSQLSTTQSQLSSSQASMSTSQSSMSSTQTSLSNALTALQNNIRAAVNALPASQTPSNNPGSSPRISTDSNTMTINGDGRAVKMQTTCSSALDPCDLLSALNGLKAV